MKDALQMLGKVVVRVFHRHAHSFSKRLFSVPAIVILSLIIVVFSFQPQAGRPWADSFFTLPSLAAPNLQINYQGKLTDASNVAVADGNYIMQFRLYTSATGATTTNIWEEIRTATGDKATVASGLFSIMLGSTTALTSVNFNQTLYLGVEVCGTTDLSGCDGEMTPRKILGATPASFEADKLDGLDATSFARLDTTSTFASGFLSTASSTITNLTMINSTSTNATTTNQAITGLATAAGTFLAVDATGRVIATTTPNGSNWTDAGSYLTPLDTTDGLLINSSTSTITNLVMVNSTTTNATTTTLYVSGTATTTFGGGLNLSTAGSNVNLATGGSFLINNANILSVNTLGASVVNSSLTSVGTLGSLAVTGLSTLSGGLLVNNATSTITNLTMVNSTTTNATSTNLYLSGGLVVNSTTATSTFSTGGFAIGTSQFVVQQNSGFVGIGTTTPSDKLTLYNGSFRQAPGNPTLIVSTSTAASAPNDVVVQGRYAYILYRNINELRIIDISDPPFPTLIGNLAMSSSPLKMVVAGRYVYVIDDTVDDLEIIDVSNPRIPTKVGSISLVVTSPVELVVSGHYVYIVSVSGSGYFLEIIDVSAPGNPVKVGQALSGVGSLPGGLAVVGRYAYVTYQINDDLEIYDVSNPTSPVIVGTLSLGTDDPTDIVVSGRYAYVISNGANDLKIIDVSNPVAPTLTKSFGIGQQPSDLTIAGRYAYVVDSDSDDLKVIDVASSTAPSLVGTLSLGAGVPTGITIAGRYAYVTDSGQNDLKIIDLSGIEVTSGIIHSLETGTLQVRQDSAFDQNLSIRGGLNVGSGGIYSSGPISISLASTTQTNPISAYFQGNVGIGTTSPYAALSVVGETVSTYFTATSTTATSTFAGAIGIGTTIPSDKLTLYNGSFRQAPGNPTLVVSTTTASWDPTAVVVQGKYTYSVGTGSDDLKIMDVSNPSFPTLVGTLAITNPGDIAVAGRYAYAISTPGNLSVVDVSNPAKPALAGSLGFTGFTIAFSRVKVQGHYAYVTNHGAGNFYIVDISNPAAPALLSTFVVGTAAGPMDFAVAGRYAYIGDRTNNLLKVVDISNPVSPILVGSSAVLTYTPRGLAVAGPYVYMGLEDTSVSTEDSLLIFDVSNPASPTLKSTTLIPNSAGIALVSFGIVAAGRYAYTVQNSSDVLNVIDVASSTAPSIVGTLAVGAIPAGLAVAGRYAYVVDNDSDDLKIIDLSGIEVTSGIIHSLEAGTLQVRQNSHFDQNLSIRGGLNIGAGGLYSSGPISISLASTTQGTATTSAYFQGNVGVGTTTPWRSLSVVGTVGFDGLTSTSTPGDSLCLSNLKEVTLRSSNTCAAASSLRFKKDIAPLPTMNGLLEVMALNPVSFSYTPEYLGGFTSNPNWNGQYVGFIAEEVQKVDPRLITIDATGQPETVRYQNLTAILVKAVQELSLRLDVATSTIASTTDAIVTHFATLEARVTALENAPPQMVVSASPIDSAILESLISSPSFFTSFSTRITGWFADVGNGIGDLFANTFRAKEKVCIGATCVNEEELKSLLRNINVEPLPDLPNEAIEANEATTTATTTLPTGEPPVIEEVSATSTEEITTLPPPPPEEVTEPPPEITPDIGQANSPPAEEPIPVP
ncbi:MAG: tail fiber domain-containing protein [Candidatus Vogelbacteria bacterium]